ncbi:RraA family protein [Burkholderiaceae bacterium FT117]|uniref:RraA family protein n=1 Tax=Zeimonas sediminis TaxID=2944268 RepID=UPI002342CDDC|nr:RraA family protein [Zeimonas sediminis]MCM5571249.1 RraA family protein [Zeimonas sediminis]
MSSNEQGAADFDARYRGRLEKLATSNLSDALDKLGLRGAVIGIVPQWGRTKVIGRAVTIRMTAAGAVQSKAHLGVDAIAASAPGDVIVIDNRGDLHNNCWGEILSMGALKQGVAGVVVDGAVRDVDACEAFGFPVHARGTVPITARGRIVQEAWNVPVRLGDVAVRPGDVVVADVNGVVAIAIEQLDRVLEAAEAIFDKEMRMVEALRAGRPIVEVDREFNYERMLER